MKTICLTILFAFFSLSSLHLSARNDRLKFSVKDAIDKGYRLNKLSKDIALEFGTQSKIKPEKSLGTFTSNKKTNSFNKSDREACEWAFLSAMISFQERARSMGGNAVINIKSIYQNIDFDSAEMFECGSGALIAGVTFFGEVAQLNKKSTTGN